MSAKILLPVEKHILKYLQHHHGLQLEVSTRGYAPFLLLNMLERHKKLDPSQVKPSQKMIDGAKYVGYPIYVGDKLERKKGLYISTDNIKSFNICMDDLLREEMFRFCNHPNRVDAVVDYNIIRFRDLYGITEDELPFDNLKRWYYRERERITTRINFVAPFVPQLTLTF